MSQTFKSLPYEPRQLQATEYRLERIYEAAKRGLEGDSLALAAGMLPVELRRLQEFDPMALYAEQKGRADREFKATGVIQDALDAGDAKIALELLKHKAGWVAKQQISVDVTKQISVTQALDMAEQRLAIANQQTEITDLEPRMVAPKSQKQPKDA